MPDSDALNEDAAARVLRLGMLTPSSNTVLEPTLGTMLAPTPDISVHFSRFRVVAINLGEAARAQFDTAPILAAARLLADAKVGSICWSGTSAGWLGIEADRALAAAITDATGIPATTAVLGLIEALHLAGSRRIGLVSPYLATVQNAILDTFAAEGFSAVAERHLDDPGNFSFAAHAPGRVAAMVREVAREGVDAAVIFCTNFRGALIAASLEAELGISVFDTVATGLWAGMRAAGWDPARITGFGSLFALKEDRD